jgi:hypothetical protein
MRHEWLSIEVGEFAKPVSTDIRKHDEKVAIRKMMRDVAVGVDRKAQMEKVES